MIEATIIGYLSGKTAAGSDVYAEIPKSQPSTYIVIEKTGSSTDDHIPTATIAIRSIAPTMLAAISLNDQVKAAMENIVELDEVCACSLNSDYNFTDSTSKQYRYQAVFQVTHY